MKQTRGFTLIEIMIIVAIVGMLAAIAIPNFKWQKASGDQPARDYSVRCVGGMKFDVHSGRQIIGPNGGGIPCHAPAQ